MNNPNPGNSPNDYSANNLEKTTKEAEALNKKVEFVKSLLEKRSLEGKSKAISGLNRKQQGGLVGLCGGIVLSFFILSPANSNFIQRFFLKGAISSGMGALTSMVTPYSLDDKKKRLSERKKQLTLERCEIALMKNSLPDEDYKALVSQNDRDFDFVNKEFENFQKSAEDKVALSKAKQLSKIKGVNQKYLPPSKDDTNDDTN